MGDNRPASETKFSVQSGVLLKNLFLIIFILSYVSQEKSFQFKVGGFYSKTDIKYVQAALKLQCGI